MEVMEQKEGASQMISNEVVVTQLKQWFENKVDHEIIETVAYECDYDLLTATTHLVEMTKQDSPPPENASTQNVQQIVTTCNSNKSQQQGKSKSANEQTLDRIIEDGKRGIKILVILRGLPGSGKSFLANKIVQESIGPCDTTNYVLSADDFFFKNGSYQYNASLISEAHRWNQNRARQLLVKGISPLIIDNTNTQSWEMKPYCIWAVENAYAIEILEPITPWAFNDKELTRRNSHNVPRSRIRDMLDRYERNITVRILFELFNLCYKDKLPPQPRNYPPIVSHTLVDLSTNEENSKPIQPDTSLNAWGITEEALRSWDIVDHVVDNNNGASTEKKIKFQQKPIEHKDCETMTGFTDTGRILFGKDKFINPTCLTPKNPKDGSFDKSTMTEEDCSDLEEKVCYLTSLFENIPVEYLRDVLDKCRGDLEYTIDILLSDKRELVQGYEPPPPQAPKKDVTEPKPQSPFDETKKVKKKITEEGMIVKQLIESNVVINKAHYSNYLLKLKKMEPNDPQPSTSKTKEVIVLDSDLEFDDDDDEDEDMEVIDISDESDTQETMELNLGDNFVQQLDKAFGDPQMKIPEGFQSVIEIPVSLGRQLHALYLESIFKQMDVQNQLLQLMIREDEEFAKKLQEQEFQQWETPNLKQIMNDQLEHSTHQKIVDEWKNLLPDDLAYKLTKQKLITSFPDVDPETLVEILVAHNNCYKDTVEVLLSSGISTTDDPNIKELPVPEGTLQEMRDVYQAIQSNNDADEEQSANDLRETARRYQSKRQELLEKARNYFSRGMYEVAMFYSELASKQTTQCEKYHSLAAEQVLRESFDRLQNFSTIDLHCLHVKEALNALDRFLDFNIRLLNDENKKTFELVHIITGRGKNSPGGVPRIKPAVRQRLKKRGIKFEQLNRGLIRAKIVKNSVMTTSLA